MAPEALIFDVDGTLAETEEWHRAAFNAAFAAAGLAWQWDRTLYAALLDVTGGKERIRRYATMAGTAISDEDVARLHAAKTARYVALVADGAVTLRPGVARLLEEARSCGLKLAIATTTSPANVTALLRATLGAHAEAWFSVVAAGDMVRAKKPAPDVYRLALERLGLAAAACVAFEDTPHGLAAARGAGIATVITTSLYGGVAGFADAMMVVDGLGEPDAPCRVLQGPRLDGAMVRLADLQRLVAVK